MKQRKKAVLLVLAVILVFALVFVGCDHGPPPGGGNGGGGVTDPALNGVWGYAGHNFRPFFIFNNGNFDFFHEIDFRGTYTTSGNNLTLIFTHTNFGFPYGSQPTLRTMAETRALLQAAGYWSDVLWLDRYFIPPQILSYFISGNTLQLIGDVVDGSIILHRVGTTGETPGDNQPGNGGGGAGNEGDSAQQPQQAPPAPNHVSTNSFGFGIGHYYTVIAPPRSIIIMWSAINHEAHYRIERADSAIGPWHTISNGARTSVGLGRYFVDTGLPSNTTFFYRIIRIVNSIESLPSLTVSGTSRPLAPTGVTATRLSTYQNDWNQDRAIVQIAWDAPVDGVTHHQVGMEGQYSSFLDLSHNGTFTGNSFTGSFPLSMSNISFIVVAIGKTGYRSHPTSSVQFP